MPIIDNVIELYRRVAAFPCSLDVGIPDIHTIDDILCAIGAVYQVPCEVIIFSWLFYNGIHKRIGIPHGVIRVLT
jgi:hypothetical protein